MSICPSPSPSSASDHAPVRADGSRRDRWVLLALSGPQGGQDALSAAACGAFLSALRLVAHAASHGSRQGLCRLWRGLCLCGVGLVAGGGWGAADLSGSGGRGGGPGGDGGVDGWRSAVLSVASLGGLGGILKSERRRSRNPNLPLSSTINCPMASHPDSVNLVWFCEMFCEISG